MHCNGLFGQEVACSLRPDDLSSRFPGGTAKFLMTKVTPLSAGAEGAPSRRRIHLREISGDSETPLETVGQDLMLQFSLQ